ncbi:Hachiman antiphage defense system protein HamA [Azospirillum thermophilum]|uniref:Hachiman antiphage defense system protein HamA n=1 Tax=Azospirillum thermophilum TaxID=2202148 RepID=UPI001B3BA20E|nr:Hachiman antiphage defense system protein HamA [Azospirillum thermophilum]
MLELKYHEDDAVMSAWAKHFRHHYCDDEELRIMVKGSKKTRSEYLHAIIFPDESSAPGPSIRSGDFAEILLADYLEYALGYWVPRNKYAEKGARNESVKGSDIIGFRVTDWYSDSNDDELYICEAKAQLSGNKPHPRLQNAIDDSAKDMVRQAESLHAIKRHLYRRYGEEEASKIERFQDVEDRPYRRSYGAAAVFNNSIFDKDSIQQSDSSKHPEKDSLYLITIKGESLMELVRNLYNRAANEA